LIDDFFGCWIPSESSILDLGCGYGEFINNVRAENRYALDLNPDAKQHLASDVTFIQHDCSEPWPIESECLDVVFSSNFLEHLPTKHHLASAVQEAARCLRSGGTIILMGPNIRYANGAYWDFYDHHVPLTERSVVELLTMEGFSVEVVHARFLPFTMSDGRSYPQWVLRAYLRTPLAWRIFGKQFVVVARRGRPADAADGS
jgi:SAM-dependent methyltransferase